MAAPFVEALSRVTALCFVENQVREALDKKPCHEITPFQGWVGLGALFPGRCPGLSHGAPLGPGVGEGGVFPGRCPGLSQGALLGCGVDGAG